MAIGSIGSTSSSSALSGLHAADKKKSDAIKQLISGLRINGAADDSSGLSISTGLDSQIRGLTTASYNAQSAVSLLQVADGGLDQTTQLLQRVRDLTVQAAGTSDAGALSAISNEITQALQGVDHLAQTTSFGTKRLLDGSLAGGTSFQIGASGTSADQFNVSVPASGSSALGLSGLAGTVAGGGASNALGLIDSALKTVTTTRSHVGSAQNSLGSALEAISTEIANSTSSKSLITDADMAQAVLNNSLADIQRHAGVSMLAQSNQQARGVLQLLR